MVIIMQEIYFKMHMSYVQTGQLCTLMRVVLFAMTVFCGVEALKISEAA